MNGQLKLCYRAEPADTGRDGKEVRIIAEFDGPYSHYRDEKPRHVETITEEQARQLRDDLNRMLG
jgi:hypothetical protein